MTKDFKEFIARGNVVELAVGIAIGAAFTTVVNSLVKDILTPPIGWMTAGVDFTEWYVNLSGTEYASLAEAQAAGAPTINYGVFFNNLVQFLIVAFALFLVIRSYNRMRRKAPPPPPAVTEKVCPFCLLKVPLAATRCAHCTSELPEAA